MTVEKIKVAKNIADKCNWLTRARVVSLHRCARTNVRRRIFEGKLSVSPYFLHHYQDDNEAGMLLIDNLSLKAPGVYLFIIF